MTNFTGSHLSGLRLGLSAVLADKARIGHTDQIRELLRKYGADRLSAVDPKHYEALLRDVEGLDDGR